MYFLLKKM